nr:hypothetical protein DM860_010389 [Ipomoea trifida]
MGVQWAKRKGYRDCEIQTDCERIANSINDNSWTRNGQDHAFDFLRKNIMEQGVDRVVHVYREQNQVADRLAKFVLLGKADWIEFDEPHPCCCNGVDLDQIGGCMQRFVFIKS